MGMSGAYGGGASEAIDQIMLQRLRQAQLGEQMRAAQVQEQQHQQVIEQQAAQQRLQEQDRQDRLNETAYQHRQGEASKGLEDTLKAADVIPPGAQMPFGGDIPGRLRAIGQTQDVGVTPEAPPDSIAAPQGPTGPMAGTINNAPSPAGRLVLKLPSAKQADIATDNDRQARAVAEQAARDTEIVRHNKAVEAKPSPVSTVTIQTVDGQGNPITRVVPKSEAIGKDYAAKPSAQDIQHSRTTKETLDTLAQLDQAIDAAKDLIGPGSGRISNLEQMAGSADPRIQALGVKMKAAKMRVDHAITGSVRAGASPVMMQQWDNILANKVTPEGLKAGVQAMRELLGGGSAPASGGSGIKSITEIK